MRDEVIRFVKIESGEYESEDGRFHIVKIWDRMHGNHWCLRDRNNPDYYKGNYHNDTLKQCKRIAKCLLKGMEP